MQLKTNITVTLPKETCYFEEFSVEAIEEGTRIKAKSTFFKNYFSGVPKGPTRSIVGTPWEPLLGTTRLTLPAECGRGIRLSSQLFLEADPNILWILHPELDKGISFVLQTPLSLNNIEDYFSGCIRLFQEMYLSARRNGGGFSAQLSAVDE